MVTRPAQAHQAGHMRLAFKTPQTHWRLKPQIIVGRINERKQMFRFKTASACFLDTYVLLHHLDIAGSFVEGVVPPVIGELLGGIVAHAGRVKL